MVSVEYGSRPSPQIKQTGLVPGVWSLRAGVEGTGSMISTTVASRTSRKRVSQKASASVLYVRGKAASTAAISKGCNRSGVPKNSTRISARNSRMSGLHSTGTRAVPGAYVMSTGVADGVCVVTGCSVTFSMATTPSKSRPAIVAL